MNEPHPFPQAYIQPMTRVLTGLMLVAFLALAGCSTGGEIAFRDLPPGDAQRGAALFTEQVRGAPACSLCHALDSERINGPALNGFSAVAGTRVEGFSAQEYSLQSIMRPAAHLVSTYPNVMYNQYKERLSRQQIADLIAYLLTL
jgi:cytochrome c553